MNKDDEYKVVGSMPEVEILHPGGVPMVESSVSKRDTVSINKTTIDKYHEALDRDRKFFYRIKQFLAAESEAGRIASIIKDFALIFVPYGRQIDTATDFISEELINTNKPVNTMQNPTNEPEGFFGRAYRFIKQETTQDGIAVLAAVAGTIFGLDVDTAEFTQSALGIVAGLGGTWASIKSLIKIFRDEDKNGS